MGLHDDMKPGALTANGSIAPAATSLDLGNGVVVSVAEATRKSGLNDSDINTLVRLVQSGKSYQEACRVVTATCSISGAALAAWRPEIERRARRDPNKPHSLKDFSGGDLVLPSADNELEQCTFRFTDLPVDKCRCILRRHIGGGHVPGIPKYQGGANVPLPPRPSEMREGPVLFAGAQAQSEPQPTATGEKFLLPGYQKAASPKTQCRFVDDEGERCALERHDDGQPHLNEAEFEKGLADLLELQALSRARAAKPAFAESGKEQCRAFDDDGERCLLVAHDELVEHVFTRLLGDDLPAQDPEQLEAPPAKAAVAKPPKAKKATKAKKRAPARTRAPEPEPAGE